MLGTSCPNDIRNGTRPGRPVHRLPRRATARRDARSRRPPAPLSAQTRVPRPAPRPIPPPGTTPADLAARCRTGAGATLCGLGLRSRTMSRLCHGRTTPLAGGRDAAPSLSLQRLARSSSPKIKYREDSSAVRRQTDSKWGRAAGSANWLDSAIFGGAFPSLFAITETE